MSSVVLEKKLIDPDEPAVRHRSGKLLLYIAIGSIVMFFAGLTSAYIVRLGEGNWFYFSLPVQFYYSTVAIIISSITINMAVMAARKDQANKVPLFVAITLALGILFSLLQFMGWKDLVQQGVFFTGKNSNASGSFMYALTGLHLVHLAAGLISLVVVWVKARQGKYTANNYAGLSLSATYWHFLDFLWIYLFLFLSFIR